MRRLSQRLATACICCAAMALATLPALASEPQWNQISSSHFSVLTDAGEKKGREVIVRFEQMRAVFGQLLLKSRLNLSEPLQIIALKSDKAYAQIAPLHQGQPISAPGFFLPGEDRNYIVLNLFGDDSWRAVSHDFAHLLLTYNYPPTQAWFDEGFAEYFASMRLDNKQVQMGADPELGMAWQEDVLGNQTEVRNPPKSLTELLSAPVWLAIPDLFAMKHTATGVEGTHHTLFYAQSWIVMHYLLNNNKLSETGTYFELVQNQKLPIEEAIQKAYGMTPAQLDQAVKAYFHSLAPLFQAVDAAKQASVTNPGGQLQQFASPIVPENVGISSQPVTDATARALVAEMALRLPERREQSLKELHAIASDPKTDNVVVHRALAWDHMERKEFDQATEELSDASEIDAKDAWIRYYLALGKYRAARTSGEPIQGLANMMLDLRAVLDWDPEFAEAYNMLGMARVEGGGINSSLEAMRAAIQLSPRNEQYRMNLAEVYVAGKKWDAATALLEQLKGSPNPQVARVAKKTLEDLPTLKKYGILPQRSTSSANQRPTPNDDAENDRETPAEPPPDKRLVKFLKAKIIGVDCSQSPAAVLTVVAAGKSIRLRTENYKVLLLIGVDEFSCDWKNRPASINYKAGGKADGDLVSLELQ